MQEVHRSSALVPIAAIGMAASLVLAADNETHVAGSAWWKPGQGTPLAPLATYDNEVGRVGLLNTSGEVVTRGHPFFEPIGSNGRACVTCHQPADGMSLSLQSIRERWQETAGKDPLFAPVDGMNCPNLPPEDPRSHSLLLERGLFRIALPWPPRRADGTPIDPEFTMEVVRDPTAATPIPCMASTAHIQPSLCTGVRAL
jgi:hypothetical protein